MPAEPDSYIKTQLSRIEKSPDEKSSIQIRGGASGCTNWISVDEKQLAAIEGILLYGAESSKSGNDR